MVKDLEEGEEEDEEGEFEEHRVDTAVQGPQADAEMGPTDIPAEPSLQPSQEAIAAALANASSFRSKSKPDLSNYSDLRPGEAQLGLCKKDSSASGRAIYCSREGCGSLILAAGVAKWVVAEGDVVSAVLDTPPNGKRS
jgi:hypothetical protein